MRLTNDHGLALNAYEVQAKQTKLLIYHVYVSYNLQK